MPDTPYALTDMLQLRADLHKVIAHLQTLHDALPGDAAGFAAMPEAQRQSSGAEADDALAMLEDAGLA